MEQLRHCPKCGYNLIVAEKKIEKQIDSWINGKHKDSLKWPRLRSKILYSILGFILGVGVSLFLLVAFTVTFESAINELHNNISGNTPLLDLTFQQILTIFSMLVIIVLPPVGLTSVLGKNAVPVEEKRLRKEKRQKILGIKTT